MKKKLLACILGLTLAAVLLAGCGDKDDDADAAEEVVTEEAEEAEEEEAVEEEPEEEAEATEEEATEEEATEESGEETDDTQAKIDALKATFPSGFAGAGDDGSELYWALSEDASSGILVIVSADGSENMVFVGDVTDNGDGTVTITDNDSGSNFTVGVEASQDDEGKDCVILTISDSVAALYPVPGDKVIDAMMSM